MKNVLGTHGGHSEINRLPSLFIWNVKRYLLGFIKSVCEAYRPNKTKMRNLAKSEVGENNGFSEMLKGTPSWFHRKGQ